MCVCVGLVLSLRIRSSEKKQPTCVLVKRREGSLVQVAGRWMSVVVVVVKVAMLVASLQVQLARSLALRKWFHVAVAEQLDKVFRT